MTESQSTDKLKKLLKSNPVLKKAVDDLSGLKVEDPVLLNLSGISTVFDDYLIICTCQSEAQMRSVLSHIRKLLTRLGVGTVRAESGPGVRWGILHCNELILHVFEKQTRAFYSLERMWGEAECYPITIQQEAEITEEEDDEYI